MANGESIDYTDGDISEGGLPGWLKHKYNEAVAGVAEKAGRGVAAVAASGFVKGAIVAAGLALAVGALMFGFSAASGQLFMNAVGALVPATFEQGLAVGAAQTLSFLGSGFGLAFMGAGGAVGTAIGIRSHQRGIEAEQAKLRAVQREIQREMEKQRGRAPIPPAGRDTPSEPKWVERLERAAERMEQATKQMESAKQRHASPQRNSDGVSFCARELQQRESHNSDEHAIG